MGTLRIGNDVVVPLLVQENGGGESDIKRLHISSNMLIDNTATAINSYDTYNFDTVKTFGAYYFNTINGNRYSTYGGLLGNRIACLFKDNNNYFGFTIVGYTISFKNVKNGVTLNNLTYDIRNTLNINAYKNIGFYFDFMFKKALVYGGSETDETKLLEIDISEYDLSHLDNFNLCGSLNVYTEPMKTCCGYITINAPRETCKQQFIVNQYNYLYTYDTTIYGINSNQLRIGGTILETIDSNHKKVQVTNANGSYFQLGCECGMTMPDFRTHLLVKFSDVSDDFYYRNSKVAGGGYIEDKDGNQITELNKTNVVEDEWYLLRYRVQNTEQYAYNYQSHAKGTFKLEAIAIGDFSYNGQNVCGETWNGNYFEGILPFSGESISFSKTLDTHLFLNNIKITNGIIYMYNGTVWKQISS